MKFSRPNDPLIHCTSFSTVDGAVLIGRFDVGCNSPGTPTGWSYPSPDTGGHRCRECWQKQAGQGRWSDVHRAHAAHKELPGIALAYSFALTLQQGVRRRRCVPSGDAPGCQRLELLPDAADLVGCSMSSMHTVPGPCGPTCGSRSPALRACRPCSVPVLV